MRLTAMLPAVPLLAAVSLAVPAGHAAWPGGPGRPSLLPPAHTVIVVMENHAYGEIIGSPHAPFLNALARQGALFTASYAQTHPSQPNYLALFSGSTQGVTGDSCPHRFAAANLGSELIAAGLTFAGYAEGLPATGSRVCDAGRYARRHVPWADFSNVPAAASKPFSRFPSGHYGRLPTVSFVVPDVCHDMHSCPPGTGDRWLRDHLGGYARWAMAHDSLLIVTFDEDDGSAGNHIPTIFAGQMVRPGSYAMRISHYRVLRTVEQLYGLAPSGHAATARPITGVWN
ncbi:MAG TPA: alkaline phosphatase family protein [Streptosporangiaceae bacterium]|jgi:acid phosphatase|nr:alkaline phosphatase family protein [Streptosporangiaceae bacterium]